MKFFHHLNAYIQKARWSLGALCWLAYAQVYAALPQIQGSGLADNTNFFDEFQNLAKSAGSILILVVSLAAFLVVTKNMIAIYSEIADGKKTWGDMGMHVGVGILLLVVIISLLTIGDAIL